MNQTVPYLAGVADRRLTYEAGENVTLPLEHGQRYTNFTVKGPGIESPDRLGQPVSGSALMIPAPPLIGQWTVTASGADRTKPRTFGFSVNPPSAETEIVTLKEENLDTLFGGKGHYALAEDPDQLKRAMIDERVGRELFPFLMALILILVTGENILANTFYRERSASPLQKATV